MRTIFSTILALFLANTNIGQSVVTRSSSSNTNIDKTSTNTDPITYICPTGQMPAPLDLLKMNENTDGWSDGLRFAIFDFPISVNSVNSLSKTYHTNNAILQGTFMGYGRVQTHNICLTIGQSYIVTAPDILAIYNDDEIGLIVCNDVYIGPGQKTHIRMTDEGCKTTSIKISSVDDDKRKHKNYISVDTIPNINMAKITGLYIPVHSYHSVKPPLFSHSISFCSPSPSPSPTTLSPSPSPTTQIPSPTSLSTNCPTTKTQFPTSSFPPPTFSPVNFPTPGPSLADLPTFSPTIQTLPIAQFQTAIVLSVSSNAPYDSQTELAICSATAKTLSIDPSTCQYDGTLFTQTSRRQLSDINTLDHNIRLLSTYNAASSLTIAVPAANPAAFFATASTNLAAAASSGSFTVDLQSACQSLGVVNAVSSATVTGTSTAGLVVILPPTASPTQSPTQNNGQTFASNRKQLLSAGDIAAATIMSVFGCIMLLYGLYYYHYNYLRIIYDNNQYSNINASSAIVSSCKDDDIFDGQDKPIIDPDNSDVALLVDAIPATEPILANTNENSQNDINTPINTIVESQVDNNDINIEIKNDYEIVICDEPTGPL